MDSNQNPTDPSNTQGTRNTKLLVWGVILVLVILMIVFSRQGGQNNEVPSPDLANATPDPNAHPSPYPTANLNGMKIKTVNEMSVSFKYPDNYTLVGIWKSERNNMRQSIAATALDPKKGGNQYSGSRVEISVIPNTARSVKDEFGLTHNAPTLIQDIAAHEAKFYKMRIRADIKTENITVSNKPAIKISFTYTTPNSGNLPHGVPATMTYVYAASDKYIYLISATSLSEYENTVASKIIESVQIL